MSNIPMIPKNWKKKNQFKAIHHILLIGGLIILFLVFSDIINITLTSQGSGNITNNFSKFS